MWSDSKFVPVPYVLKGDPKAAALFGVLEAKGIAAVRGSFRLEDGSTFIEHWAARMATGGQAPEALEQEIFDTIYDFGDVIERGLAMSLAEVWEDGYEVVANVWIDVQDKSIGVYELRQLVYTHDSELPHDSDIVL